MGTRHKKGNTVPVGVSIKSYDYAIHLQNGTAYHESHMFEVFPSDPAENHEVWPIIYPNAA